MRRLAGTDLGTVDARAWPRVAAGLLAGGSARLAAARLSGGVVALGRWQDAAVALTGAARAREPVRRVTGGRTVALGEGTFALALALPHRSWLVSDDPRALPAASFLNRAVRVVLGGLARLGVPANYFGRDFVTVDAAQAAYVSFELAPGGAALLEVVLPAEAHWWLPAGLGALPEKPPTRGVPGPATVAGLAGRTSAQLLDAMLAGARERFGVETFASDAPVAPQDVAAPPSLPRRSALVDIPAGWAQASVRLDGGTIAEASLTGDFLADSAGIQAVSGRLRGAAPTFEAVGRALDAVYGRTDHALLGIDDLAALARAFVAAAT